MLYIILRWLFILCLPWLIVTTALRIPASCPYLYEYLFQKYNVDETTGQVVEGSKTDPVKFEEYWTFTRSVGPNAWKLSAINQAK